MAEWIEQILRKHFNPTLLNIQDESHLHTHHREGGQAVGTHLRVTLYSSSFEGKSRLAIHRLVNEALADAFKGLPGMPQLHALALTAGAHPPVGGQS